MFTGQAGVFVVVVDIKQFMNNTRHTLTFNVSYEIKGDVLNSTLIANLGKFIIDSKTLYSTSLDIIQFEQEQYRNLLAITSTSQVTASVNITFYSNERIEDFLVKILNFDIVKSREDADAEIPIVSILNQ